MAVKGSLSSWQSSPGNSSQEASDRDGDVGIPKCWGGACCRCAKDLETKISERRRNARAECESHRLNESFVLIPTSEFVSLDLQKSLDKLVAERSDPLANLA